MRRHILGCLSVVLSVVGLLLMPAQEYTFLASSCWRIGTVLFVLWLAFPQLQGVSLWLRRAAIVVAVVAAAFHKYGLILLPLIFFLWLFSKKKPAPTETESASPAEATSES